jgi:hypothetical protein
VRGKCIIGILAMAKDSEQSGDKEARARFEAALKGALKTSPKPLKDKVQTKPKSKTKKRD